MDSGVEMAPMTFEACTRDREWARWPMPNEDEGLPNQMTYDTSGSTTVKDNVTGLTWDLAVAPTQSWAEGRDFCRGARKRMPTRIELISLLGSNVLPKTRSGFHWSSTPDAEDPTGSVWVVDFSQDSVRRSPITRLGVTRCVSGGSTSPGCYMDNDDGTVRDLQTRLVWQKQVPDAFFTWSEARRYCESLSIGGSGWRLPSRKELQTLVDPRQSEPAIDREVFPGTPFGYSFWSSTDFNDGDPLYTSMYVVEFRSGGQSSAITSTRKHVRCVR